MGLFVGRTAVSSTEMSSKRCDTQSKRTSNPFSIEALIATDRKNDEVDESKNESEVERQVTSSAEVSVERWHGTGSRRSGSGSTTPRQRSQRDNDDDDDDDDDDDEGGSRARSSEQRLDRVTPDEHRHGSFHSQPHHHYPHHLHQFQQLLHRPVQSVIDSIHPLMRQNLLTAASSTRFAGSDSVLRRHHGLSASEPHPTGPYCCAPPPLHGSAPTSGPGVVSQRPAGSRDDEMFPFYTWLLSRQGAFFNHRIHPAGQ